MIVANGDSLFICRGSLPGCGVRGAEARLATLPRRGRAHCPLMTHDTFAGTLPVRGTIGAVAMTTPISVLYPLPHAQRVDGRFAIAKRMAEHAIAFPEGEANAWRPVP